LPNGAEGRLDDDLPVPGLGSVQHASLRQRRAATGSAAGSNSSALEDSQRSNWRACLVLRRIANYQNRFPLSFFCGLPAIA